MQQLLTYSVQQVRVVDDAILVAAAAEYGLVLRAVTACAVRRNVPRVTNVVRYRAERPQN